MEKIYKSDDDDDDDYGSVFEFCKELCSSGTDKSDRLFGRFTSLVGPPPPTLNSRLLAAESRSRES